MAHDRERTHSHGGGGLLRGQRKRLSGDLKRHADCLRCEMNVTGEMWQKEHSRRLNSNGQDHTTASTFIASASPHTRPLCDLLEGFAGEANASQIALDFGLKTLQPCDYRYGWS